MREKLSVALVLCLAAMLWGCGTQEPQMHVTDVRSYEEVREFFRYRPGREIIVRAHRGGREAGYPENCIESFGNILRWMPAYFEIDPRLTKDSVLVLMHDATLDRTTTGSGKVRDYTYEELQQFNLVDRDGNVTQFRIPTLAEALEWGRGKTIFNIDRKDVPLEMIAGLLKEMDAVHAIPATVTPEQAAFYHEVNPQGNIGVRIRNMEEYRAIEALGIPWEQLMVYVGPVITSENKPVCELLHSHGVSFSISLATACDKIEDREERRAAYLKEIATRPDIIETDFPVDLYGVITR